MKIKNLFYIVVVVLLAVLFVVIGINGRNEYIKQTLSYDRFKSSISGLSKKDIKYYRTYNGSFDEKGLIISDYSFGELCKYLEKLEINTQKTDKQYQLTIYTKYHESRFELILMFNDENQYIQASMVEISNGKPLYYNMSSKDIDFHKLIISMVTNATT